MDLKDRDKSAEDQNTGGTVLQSTERLQDETLHSNAVKSQLRHLERTMHEHRNLLNEQQKEIRNQVKEQALTITGFATHESMETTTGITSKEITDLKLTVKTVQDKLHELLNGTQTPPSTPQRSHYFPNVDPASIRQPQIPTKTPNLRETVRPDHGPSATDNINTNRQEPVLLPYGAKVMVRLKGESHECWVQKCYRTYKGIEYDGSTSGGDMLRFQPKDIFLHDLTSTPTKPPAKYVVDMTGGYGSSRNHEYNDPTTTYNSPAYHRSDDMDNDSEMSDNLMPPPYHSSGHNRKGRNVQFAQNSFAYPRCSVPQYIREDKASTLGKNFTGHLSPDADPCVFFDSVRQEVLVQKILLLPYEHITKLTGLLEINENNCDNYSAAKKTMSRFLYNFFFQGCDTMFDGNDYAHNSLSVYAIDQDGLTFLEDLIRDSHPQLRTEVHRASITDARVY